MRSLVACVVALSATWFAHASVITFDRVAPTELAFTVEWGPDLQGGYFTQRAGGADSPIVQVLVEPDDQFGPVNRLTVDPGAAGFVTTEVAFFFPVPDVAFSDARITVDYSRGGVPISIQPTADGYGVSLVYERLNTNPAGTVPDGGSSATLLGIAGFGCLGVRRLLAGRAW